MNYEQNLCQAIDLIAADQESQAHELIESTIVEIKRFLPEAIDKAPLHFFWAQGLELLEEPEQALLQYEHALKANLEYMPAWECLCRVLLEELDRPEEAKSIVLSRLLPSDPENENYQDWLAKAELALNDHKFTRPESTPETEALGQEN